MFEHLYQVYHHGLRRVLVLMRIEYSGNIWSNNLSAPENATINKNNETDLHLATLLNLKNCVKTLISNGANVNAVCKLLETPLHRAVKKDLHEIVKILLANHADISLRNLDGETPVYIAVKSNHKVCLGLLMENGAKVNEIIKNQTLMHVAVRTNDVKMIKLLIDYKAEINAKSTDKGETPLHEAILNAKPLMVKCLLENGANIDFQCNDLETPLHKAVKSNNLQLVQILLQRGANMNLMSKENSALHIAIWEGYDDIVKLLIKNNADHSAAEVTLQFTKSSRENPLTLAS